MLSGWRSSEQCTFGYMCIQSPVTMISRSHGFDFLRIIWYPPACRLIYKLSSLPARLMNISRRSHLFLNRFELNKAFIRPKLTQAIPWFPVEAVTMPLINAPGSHSFSSNILLNAPRILNDPVTCSLSEIFVRSNHLTFNNGVDWIYFDCF